MENTPPPPSATTRQKSPVLIGLIVEVLDDQNLFTDLNLANWFSSYVQFCLGGRFSERAEAAR